MNRRRVIVTAAVLTLLASVIVALLLVPCRAPLARAYDRLELGMTPDEVIAVTGLEPTRRSDLDHTLRWNVMAEHGARLPIGEGGAFLGWLDDDYLIEGHFNYYGRLAVKQLKADRTPTWFERLRRWLGR